MEKQFGMMTETEKHEKYTRERIQLTLDEDLCTLLRCAASVKTLKGKRSTMSGIVEYALNEFIDNHYHFFNAVKEYVDKYGIDGRYI